MNWREKDSSRSYGAGNWYLKNLKNGGCHKILTTNVILAGIFIVQLYDRIERSSREIGGILCYSLNLN